MSEKKHPQYFETEAENSNDNYEDPVEKRK